VSEPATEFRFKLPRGYLDPKGTLRRNGTINQDDTEVSSQVIEILYASEPCFLAHNGSTSETDQWDSVQTLQSRSGASFDDPVPVGFSHGMRVGE
jgi:hypothetical protein